MTSTVGLVYIFFGIFLSKALGDITSTTVKVINHAGSPIEMFWIDPYKGDGTLVKQTSKPVRNNSEHITNSYDTHEFLVRFLKPIKCAQARFTKGPIDETVTVTYDAATNEMKLDQKTKFHEVTDNVLAATKSCGDKTGDEFAKCIAQGVMVDFMKIAEAKIKADKYRDILAGKMRNYTCDDRSMETTSYIRSFDRDINGKVLTHNVLHDTDHAKIWTVDDFISEEECKILYDHGLPLLARATVAAADGTSVVSPNRQAQQASYNIHYHGERDPLWPLYTRILAVANSHAGYALQPAGQEAFTIIQYNPNGDQYTPHCDGTCDGSLHTPTGRIATAVLYCKVAEEGGATTFTKADIFVKPKNHQATFFSYKGSDGHMDDGYTEHSGCPVTKGEKWITTVWMREGVSDEHPSTMYDPKGFKILTEADQQMVEEEAGRVYNLNDEL